MAGDGEVKIELELDDSKAKSQGTKSGQQISKGIESGLKGADTAAQNTSKNIDKAFKNSGKNAKTSFQEVGNSAKSSFNDVGDAARSASSDAASAFEEIPADASGAFADVGSEAQNGFDGVADAAHNVSSDAADAFDEIPEAAEDAAQETNNAFSVKMVAIGNIIADAAEKAVSALVDVAKAAVETGMAFDKSMSQVAATMGVTTDSIGELRDFAKEMGASTAFSATQASEALNYMALAGYDASTSMRVLPTVLNLAAAGNMELAAASDMVTDAQSALGLSVEQAEIMVDQMAKTSSKTNTSVSQLGDAFLTVGGTAKNLAGGTAELAQMLGILADNGIKGAEGGTALRNVILSLSAPTDVAAKKMDELGLAVFDAEGNMRPMPDIMRDLNKSMEPLTQQEKTDALNTIFNKVDLKSVNALLGTSAERFDEVAFAIDNATGSAKEMAETQLDNLAGDVTLLESAFEGLQIQISEAVAPVLREIVQTVTDAVIPAFSKMVDNADKIVPILANVALGFAAWKVAVPIVKSYQAAIAATGRSVQSLTMAEKAHTIATTAGTKAMQLFAKAGNLMKTALPILAISAALEAITFFADAIKDAQEKQEQYTKATDGLRDAFNQIDDAAVNTAKSLNDISTDKPRRAMADLKSSIDETIASQAELADKITEDWTDINTNSALLETYIDTINKLTNAYDENGAKRRLNDEEQAALIAAVSGYNEITGESVNVIDAVNGVLDQSTAKLNQNAEAWINNAKKQAAQEELVSLAKERLNLQKDLGEAETACRNAIDYRNKAIANGIPLTAEENQMIADSEANLKKCRDALDANTEAQQWLTDQIAEADNALRSSAEALASYIRSNEEWSQTLEDAGVNIDEFASKLSELGFSTDELATMSGEQLKALADSYKLSTDEIIAVCDNMGIEVPEKLRQVGTDSVDALAEGLSSEQQAAIDAALEVAGVTHDEFAKLVDEAGITGGDATVAYAEGIASEKQESQKAAQINATVALEGYKAEDTFAAGKGEGGAYAEGVAEAEDDSRGAGETDANAASDGMQSQNKNAHGWGFDLGSLFAKGIEAAQTVVSNAANFIGGIVKGILGHSVPAEGILRNGGQGEKPWGKHLVENIAAGMLEAQGSISDATTVTAQNIEDGVNQAQTAFERENAQMTLSTKQVDRWGESMKKAGTQIIETTNKANDTTNAINNFTSRGIQLSKSFFDYFVKKSGNMQDALKDLAKLSDQEIHQLVESYEAMKDAEREADIATRELNVALNDDLDLESPRQKMLDVREAELKLKETTADVAKAIKSDQGIRDAFNKAGISAEDFAKTLNSLEMSMSDFLSYQSSWVGKISDGFTRMSTSGATSLKDYQTNLRSNIANAINFSRELEIVSNKLKDAGVDSTAFLETVRREGFDKWGKVIQELATRNSKEIANTVELYNKSVQVGNDTAVKQFKATMPTYAREISATYSSGLEMLTDTSYQSGRNAAQGLIDGMDSLIRAVEAKGEELGEAVQRGIKTAGQEGSPWKTTIKSGEFAAEGLIIGFENVDPFKNIADSLQSNLQLLATASAGQNTTYNNDTTTVNINQPVSSPAQFMREMRKMQTFGLAGLK